MSQVSAATAVLPAATEAPALDVMRLRADFPALAQQVRGRRLVYLDSAATAQKPRVVLDALRRYYAEDCANVHRGVYALAERATLAYEAARVTVQRHLNAATEESIVFVRGATEGINLVAHSFLGPRLQPGDEVLITAMEHHANLVPWQLACERHGARLRVVPIDERGALRREEFHALLGERTRLVALCHVSNVLGTINPVAELIAAAHRLDVPVLLDSAQALPHQAVDVQQLGCDFLVFSGHKVFGPTGIGVLYGKPEHLAAMPPYQGGGEMIQEVTFERSTFREPPYRFEAGTPHIAGAIGLAAALEYLRGVGLEAIAHHEHELITAATEAVAEIPGLRILGTTPDKASVLTFVMDGVHPHDVATVLDQQGIAVRAGHHCAQPLMRRFGVPATARASFACYNTRQEVDALVAGLREVRRLFG